MARQPKLANALEILMEEMEDDARRLDQAASEDKLQVMNSWYGLKGGYAARAADAREYAQKIREILEVTAR